MQWREFVTLVSGAAASTALIRSPSRPLRWLRRIRWSWKKMGSWWEPIRCWRSASLTAVGILAD